MHVSVVDEPHLIESEREVSVGGYRHKTGFETALNYKEMKGTMKVMLGKIRLEAGRGI